MTLSCSFLWKLTQVDAGQERLLFGLWIQERTECMEMAALTDEQAAVWLDGFRVLMSEEMMEPEHKKDLDMLLE